MRNLRSLLWDADALAANASTRDPDFGITAREAGGVVVRSGNGVVTLDLDGGTTLETVVTRRSRDALDLAVGRPVVASFKATAARAIPIEVENER